MTENDQELDDWLAEIAEADRQIAPPANLEARVMARVRLGRPHGARRARPTGAVVWIGAGAALAAGVLLSLAVPRGRPQDAAVMLPVAAVAEADARPAATPGIPAPPGTPQEMPVAAAAPVERPEAGRRLRGESDMTADARSTPAGPEVFDFVPLVPLSEEELLGAFQIVRVQLSRGPGGPVQADVLLGQDGMARAIRVSTRR